MPRSCAYWIAILFSLIAAPLARADGYGVGSEWRLNAAYQLAEQRQMPCSFPHPGMDIKVTDFPAFGAMEWQVLLKPTAENAAQLYSDLQSANFTVQFPATKSIELFWTKGSHAEASDFQPHRQSLELGKPLTLESFGGRSSDGVLPYFNLIGDGGGMIFAIGWPGDWKASFERVSDQRVKIRAGLKRSHFRLKPGQELRIPSILVMNYQGSWIDGQNRFRRLMLKHFTPQNHEPLKLMPVAASVHGMIGFNDTTEANLTKLASTIAAHKLPLDTFWIDAGWNQGGFPGAQGNPTPDTKRFPRGLAPVGDSVKKTGMRFLAWFEPERAMAGTQVDREHPEWILKPTKTPGPLRYQETDGFRLVDLGIKEAREWALETVAKEIEAGSLSIYRQDFNEYPSYFWHTGETPETVGLREVLYINGLYEFLDHLKLRFPKLIMDQCASGGRRVDFEMMRRSVVLWRSDSCWDDAAYPRNVQAMSHGLSHWLPLHGLGSLKTDPVSLRSGMGACSSFPINYNDAKQVEALRAHLEKYLKIRDLFAADFSPLTDWTDKNTAWLACQFSDPASGRGIAQIFSPSVPNAPAYQLKWRKLDAKRTYRIVDWDQPQAEVKYTGGELMSVGLTIAAPQGAKAVPQAIVLECRREP